MAGNLWKRSLTVVVAACALLLIEPPARAQDPFVIVAKSFSARDFDRRLPNEPIDHWLKAHLPKGMEAIWEPELTDCGAGTGTAADEKKDLPVCAEVGLKKDGRLKGFLLLRVGTRKGGIRKSQAALYSGFLETAGKGRDLKRLGDLATR